MTKYDEWTMTGKTNEDWAAIQKCLVNDIELFVDDYGRVLDSNGNYIADCKEEEY